MIRTAAGILLLLSGLSAAGHEREESQAAPAQQYESLAKEFREAANAYYSRTQAGEEPSDAVRRLAELPPRLLEFANEHPRDPVALDALVLVVTNELWLVNNTQHPGFGKESPEVKALAILLRDHIESDKLGEACRRVQYGFRPECETFLRTVLEKNPHRDIRGLACLRLGRFLNGRAQRLDVMKEQPEMLRRYEGLFGKHYLEALRRRDRAEVEREVEAVLERAAEEFGDVKVPYGETVAEEARSDLHELRHLSVGKPAPEIEGDDQDGRRLKLGDYRGKVVLLYFWSEY